MTKSSSSFWAILSLLFVLLSLLVMPALSAPTTQEARGKVETNNDNQHTTHKNGKKTKKSKHQHHNMTLAHTPPPSVSPNDWPHGSVLVQAGNDTHVLNVNGQALPLGVPFEFESTLFKGTMLLRFRHAPSDDSEGSDSYFQGRKRLMQTVLQGQFKRKVKMSDVYVGSVFASQLAQAPPPTLSKIMEAVIRRVAPGVVVDLGSGSPKVMALMAGSAQTLSVDEPGQQPSITEKVLPENTQAVLGTAATSSHKRKKLLSHPKKAATYEFDTSHIYTFHTYDDAMDYGRGTMKIPMYGDYDIKPAIGNQPLTLTAMTIGGDVVYCFKVWHPETYEGAMIDNGDSNLGMPQQ